MGRAAEGRRKHKQRTQKRKRKQSTGTKGSMPRGGEERILQATGTQRHILQDCPTLSNFHPIPVKSSMVSCLVLVSESPNLNMAGRGLCTPSLKRKE